LDGAGPATHVTGDGLGARLTARALALLTHNRRVDGEIARDTKDDIGEVYVEAHESVLSTFGAGTRASLLLTAEEGGENIAKVTEPLRTKARLGAAVVLFTLHRITEHLIGVSDELEFLLRGLVGVYVGVKLASESTIGLLDVLRRGVTGYSQHVIVVCHGQVLLRSS
jgi:hypothetical protein